MGRVCPSFFTRTSFFPPTRRGTDHFLQDKL
ncbi:Uncharacterised protein [Vibrio cholerae]|nr:Uncharacterised protein [Vibrio cholerae]